MHPNELTDPLRASPFRPFRIYVSDGGTFDVRHPEMLMVTRRTAVVGIMTDDGPSESGNGSSFPEIDRSTTLDLLHITRIEEIADSRGRSG